MAGRFVRGGVQHNVLQQREQEAKEKLYGKDTSKPTNDKPSATGWGTGSSKANTGTGEKPDNSKGYGGGVSQSEYNIVKDASKFHGLDGEKKDDTLEKYQQKLAEASVRLTVKATAKIIKEAEERQRERNNQWMDRSAYNEEQARRRYEQNGYDSYNQMKNFNQYKSEDGYITHPKTGFRYKPRKFDDKMNHTESRGWLHRISSFLYLGLLFF